MDLSTKIAAGYLAGLSVGVFCLGLCLPVFLPILLSQKRSGKTSFFLVLEFSLGRVTGYLFFGLIFGTLGIIIKNQFIHCLVALTNIWLGILLIIFSVGIMNAKYCSHLPYQKIRWPILLGFLTGVNICPPFLASLTYIFNLKNVIYSLIYFLMFFLGTTTYIIPAACFGFLSKYQKIAKLAQISGVVIGLYFIIQNLTSI